MHFVGVDHKFCFKGHKLFSVISFKIFILIAKKDSVKKITLELASNIFAQLFSIKSLELFWAQNLKKIIIRSNRSVLLNYSDIISPHFNNSIPNVGIALNKNTQII